MEYKGKTRQYRIFAPALFLLLVLIFPSILKAQITGQEYLQGLIDKDESYLPIDLRGKTYTASQLTVSGEKKIVLFSNGHIKQSDSYNNESLFVVDKGCILILQNITISGSDYGAENSLIYLNEGGCLNVNEGAVITKGLVSDKAYASCVHVTKGADLVMRGGEIHGNKALYGEVCVDAGGRFDMFGGNVGWVYAFDNIYIGKNAKIRDCLYLCNSTSRVLVMKQFGNICDITVSKAGGAGTIIASESLGEDLTWDDVAKFHDYSGKHGFALKNGIIVFAGEGESAPPIETEDDLSEKIDELPAGTEESPSEVVVEQEIPLTKPVGVNDKYIDLGGGGTLISQNSDAGIIINKGGLTLNDIVIRGEWTNASTLLDVKNGGYLKIGLATEIVSISDYLRTILIDKLSSVVSEGRITGHISNTGSLFVKDGSIEGQISSFSPFKFSGKVAVKNGIYLGRGNGTNGLINLVDPLRSSLNILVDEKMIADATSSVLIAQGTDGYMPTESDLDKLVCFTDDCEFYLHGYQILMRKIDHTANEQINRESLQLRTSGQDIHVEGVPAGQPYGLYDLSGTLLSGGVSDGGTISLSVSHPGIYIFHVAGIGKKVQISR